MPGTLESSSESADITASMLPNARAMSRAVVAPTCLMPNANSRFSKPRPRLSWMASTMFLEDFSAIPSSPIRSEEVRS